MLDTYQESVVDEQILTQIETAIAQVERTLTLGQSSTSALSALGAALDQMEEGIEAPRFADTGLLLSRSALK